tara:strand:+ start:429 stop:1385 length:957 start_codon:yes stop_codon:yes gene_type:complete
LDASNYIYQVRSINNADIIWVRVRPEYTTDNERKKIDKRICSFRGSSNIINDISVFDNYDCKDMTFSIWKDQNIKCPDFTSFSLTDISKNFNKCIKDIQLFIKKHRKVIIRTNNETGGNGMFILESSSSKKEIIDILTILRIRCLKFISKRSSTRVMVVQFISTEDPNGLIDLYRVHISLGKIISYYAVTSKLDVFHSVDMNYKDLNRFISINEYLRSKILNLEKIILSTAKTLGCSIGAVEFFLINDEPIFLEFNPMWGGNASKFGFGQEELRDYLDKNRSTLEKNIPNIYQFTDYQLYYKSLYQNIHKHYQSSDKL